MKSSQEKIGDCNNKKTDLLNYTITKENTLSISSLKESKLISADREGINKEEVNKIKELELIIEEDRRTIANLTFELSNAELFRK